MSNNNNNNYTKIKDQSEEFKIDFINNVLCQTELPCFGLKKQTKTQNIFFRTENGQKIKREWLFFENGHFLCAYCICFAARNVFVTGVEMNSRTSDYVKKHDGQSYHDLARRKYVELISPPQAPSQSAKWKVLRAIVKVIIFVGTHGQYFFHK